MLEMEESGIPISYIAACQKTLMRMNQQEAVLKGNIQLTITVVTLS